MNKAKKSLLFSLLSLVFALAITATSTYAWFVVNREVSATNMQVTVKSDTTYLVISSASTAEDNGALDSTDTTVALTAANPKEVLPVRYNASANPESGYEKWETAAGTAYNNGAAKDNAYSSVATANLGNYVLDYVFYVGLTHTTAQAASNLKIKDLNVTNTAASDPDNTFKPAVSVVVNCGDVYLNCTDNNGIDGLTEAQCNAFGTLVPTVALDTVYTIHCYVYINGDNPVVTSEHGANLATFALEIVFAID